MPETSLHASLKEFYAPSIDDQEIWVDGFQIDAIRDSFLIEIQTSNFEAIKPKLASLLPAHKIIIVHPIALEKWIIQIPIAGNTTLSRRKSPSHGRIEDIFKELVYIADFLIHPNLRFEIVFIRKEEIRRADGQGSWRRKGISIVDHRLLEVVRLQQIAGATDFQNLLPRNIIYPLTTQDLADTLNIRRPLAYRMIYCLRKAGILYISGKRGRTRLYDLTDHSNNAQREIS